MDIQNEIKSNLEEHLKVAELTRELEADIVTAVELVIDTFKNGKKIMLAGNGGSAADAQHWAAEWSIRLSHHLDRPSMPALALTTDTSALTAGGNDIGFENIFARQLEGLAHEGDLLIGISTSGNSGNVIRAIEKAHEKGVKVLGILGGSGGKMKDVCDHAVIIPSKNTQRIQEMHVFVGHMMCELSERFIYE